MATLFILLAAAVLAAWTLGIWLLRRTSSQPSATSISKGIAYFVACCVWAVGAYLVFVLALLSINATLIAVSLGFSLTFLLLALVLVHKSWTAHGMLAAAAPLPLLIFLAFVVNPLLENHIIPMLESEPAEFTDACRNAGANYIRPPATLVHSIAYRWIGNSSRDYVCYTMTRYGRVGGMYGGGGCGEERYPKLKEALNFKKLDGATSEERKKVADVLVTYRVSPESELQKAPVAQGLVTRELTVTDQRDGQLLATLMYVVDLHDHRICGPIVDGVFNEHAFLAKALALDSFDSTKAAKLEYRSASAVPPRQTNPKGPGEHEVVPSVGRDMVTVRAIERQPKPMRAPPPPAN